MPYKNRNDEPALGKVKEILDGFVRSLTWTWKVKRQSSHSFLTVIDATTRTI